MQVGPNSTNVKNATLVSSKTIRPSIATFVDQKSTINALTLQKQKPKIYYLGSGPVLIT
jgi:hypothetical protein